MGWRFEDMREGEKQVLGIVVVVALIGAAAWFYSARSQVASLQERSFEHVCQDLISRFDQYSRYSLSFERREWGAIYTKTNPNRNAGLYATYRINGTPIDRLSAACYTKPDEMTLALIEVLTPPKNYLWCNYSGLGRWESGDCNWNQNWPLFEAFGSITPSRVTETAQAREQAKAVAQTQPQPSAPASNALVRECMLARDMANGECDSQGTSFTRAGPAANGLCVERALRHMGWDGFRCRRLW
jgi:hypothetical protein